MTALDRRLEKIKELAELAQAEQARREPFAVVYVRSLHTGIATICYRPMGCYGSSESILELTVEQVKAWFGDHPGVHCVVSLARCVEWLHAFYQRCELYTPEQQERAKAEDLSRWPEVAELYRGENSPGIIDTLASLPERWSM